MRRLFGEADGCREQLAPQAEPGGDDEPGDGDDSDEPGDGEMEDAPLQEQQQEAESEGEEEYTIAAILEQRGRGRGTEYLVEWLGYNGETTYMGVRSVPQGHHGAGPMEEAARGSAEVLVLYCYLNTV